MLLGALLAAPRALAQPARIAAPQDGFAPVVPGYRLEFPQDEGSHPAFRIEWWYVTGWLDGTAGRALGFQLTFFRARPELKHANPSAFTPRHVVIAHAALSDPARGRLLHAQRAARAGFGLAGADEGRTNVWIDGWHLRQRGRHYEAVARTDAFALQLDFVREQPPLLHGEQGLSRKGPAALSASYYYSLPHLAASGVVGRAGAAERVRGTAWLDHEWSSHYLPEDAVGWDWIGINLENGAALMAFRMRTRAGDALWAGGSLRQGTHSVRTYAPAEIRFTPQREWRSPRTGARYPVAWRIRAGDLDLSVEPLFDDQEHDARASTGTIYWEGAVRALVAGRPAGRGYLELTGYWRPQRF